MSSEQRPSPSNTRAQGALAEDSALRHLLGAGLTLVQRNYRTPHRGGGEIDLIMLAADGTLVFVEVRHRQDDRHGGAGASVGRVKQRRITYAARWYLQRYASPPPCRFDVMLRQDQSWQWIPGAFEASAW